MPDLKDFFKKEEAPLSESSLDYESIKKEFEQKNFFEEQLDSKIPEELAKQWPALNFFCFEIDGLHNRQIIWEKEYNELIKNRVYHSRWKSTEFQDVIIFDKTRHLLRPSIEYLMSEPTQSISMFWRIAIVVCIIFACWAWLYIFRWSSSETKPVLQSPKVSTGALQKVSDKTAPVLVTVPKTKTWTPETSWTPKIDTNQKNELEKQNLKLDSENYKLSLRLDETQTELSICSNSLERLENKLDNVRECPQIPLKDPLIDLYERIWQDVYERCLKSPDTENCSSLILENYAIKK